MIASALFFLGLAGAAAAAQTNRPANPVPAAAGGMSVGLGDAVVPLNGPWKFHVGDDMRWAQAGYDDSSWETVDLTPPTGAHDSDVGLTGYVPGWGARGHSGYSGYAWYRLRVSASAPAGESLAICGPFYVDYAYQIFVNGRLLGGVGDFSRQPPTAYNIHLPKIYPLAQTFGSTPSGSGNSVLIAVRAWMGPWALGATDAGGIHIAPALGTTAGAESLYHIQWSQVIKGYIVDASEGLFFLLLAAMACMLIPFDRSNPAYRWLAAALISIAFARANQAVFFWWQFESVQGFELATIVLFVPLSLGAWTMAWCSWLRLHECAWMPKVVGIITVLYIVMESLRRSWFYGDFPHWVNALTGLGITLIRLLFALLTCWIIFRGLTQKNREKWLTLASIVLISIGLFASELSLLHIPGIWFPFGVGVSRTQYAYAGFDAVFFALLLQRLFSFARERSMLTLAPTER
ncbi:MAG TPA: hypothetical protein VGR81_12745 [Candidatus Acidoferrales bacterium]|nr:hypothetical protein [Candidatus Acidoferrales bacterium]